MTFDEWWSKFCADDSEPDSMMEAHKETWNAALEAAVSALSNSDWATPSGAEGVILFLKTRH